MLSVTVEWDTAAAWLHGAFDKALLAVAVHGIRIRPEPVPSAQPAPGPAVHHRSG